MQLREQDVVEQRHVGNPGASSHEVPDPPTARIRLIGRQLRPGATEETHRAPLRRQQPAGEVRKHPFVLLLPRLHEHQIPCAQSDIDGDAGVMVVGRRQPDVVELQHGPRTVVAQSTLTKPLTRKTASTDRMKPMGIKAWSARASCRCSMAVRQHTTPIAKPMPRVLRGSTA
jgi:hypothetical protein